MQKRLVSNESTSKCFAVDIRWSFHQESVFMVFQSPSLIIWIVPFQLSVQYNDLFLAHFKTLLSDFWRNNHWHALRKSINNKVTEEVWSKEPQYRSQMFKSCERGFLCKNKSSINFRTARRFSAIMVMNYFIHRRLQIRLRFLDLYRLCNEKGFLI